MHPGLAPRTCIPKGGRDGGFVWGLQALVWSITIVMRGVSALNRRQRAKRLRRVGSEVMMSAKDALVCGATGGRIYGAVGSIGRRSLPRSRADPETAQKPWDPKRWGPGRADAWCLTAEAGWLGSSKHGDLESRIV